jgi:hypothetical protein
MWTVADDVGAAPGLAGDAVQVHMAAIAYDLKHSLNVLSTVSS